jgi:hypothetical protein
MLSLPHRRRVTGCFEGKDGSPSRPDASAKHSCQISRTRKYQRIGVTGAGPSESCMTALAEMYFRSPPYAPQAARLLRDGHGVDLNPVGLVNHSRPHHAGVGQKRLLLVGGNLHTILYDAGTTGSALEG